MVKKVIIDCDVGVDDALGLDPGLSIHLNWK